MRRSFCTRARTQTQHVICGQGVAPQPPRWRRSRDTRTRPDSRRPALLPAVVPGAFDAWCLMLRDWGTWELADVLAFAIGYAQNGIHIVPRISATIESVRPLFEAEWKVSAAVFLPGGNVPGAGQPVRAAPRWPTPTNASAAKPAAPRARRASMRRAAAWYRGFVAEAVDRFFRSTDVLDVTGRRHRGLLAADDFAALVGDRRRPASRTTITATRVLKCGPWSQGPVFLQQLALLRGFDIGAMDPLGADFVHTVVECAKLAYADREAYYGDPNFVDVPLGALLSDEYNAERRKLVGRNASLDLRPGTVPGYTPGRGSRRRAAARIC